MRMTVKEMGTLWQIRVRS